jgi:uncharacterized membrane protein
MLKFLKTTMVGGILFLVPIIIFIAVIGKALELTKKLAAPLSVLIPLDSIGNIAMVNLLALCIVLLICSLAGLAAKSTLARKSIGNLESRVLSKIPVYGLLKSKIDAIVQPEKAEGMKPVLARFDDSWQIAFKVERIQGGVVALYLPGAPDPWSGSVCFVTEDRIQPLELALLPVLRTLKGLGKGSNEQLRTYLKKVQ